MTVKILIAALLLLAGFQWLYPALSKQKAAPETPIDQRWWDGLSEEWKTIFRINQYFHRHQVDFYRVQTDYLNRLQGPGEEAYTEWNTSLRDLNAKRTFLLSYQDMYARVCKAYPDDAADSIDLSSLQQLERIYMVSGPGDLTPLKKFPGLKVLIANYCGINHGLPLDEQVLDLEPLRQLGQLEHLHCVSPALKSLEPIEGLVNLVLLYCDNSDVSTLAPLKKLRRLENLSFGDKVKEAGVIRHLSNLKALHIAGCKQIPDLSDLTRLQKLCIVENELALVDGRYRLKDLSVLQNLVSLEFLDFELSSYRGSLEKLQNLKHLKAATLPRVSTADMLAFKQAHEGCVILNAHEW